MPASKLEPGSNQPGDTAILGNGQRALVVVLANDDGSLPSGQPIAGSAGVGIPAGATSVHSSSGNVANASAVATLPAVAAKRNYVTGFEITGAGATAAAVVVATLAGILGGTASYIVTAPAGVTTPITPTLIVTYDTPIPGSAVNTAITLTLPALGAGNTNAAVTLHGFVL